MGKTQWSAGLWETGHGTKKARMSSFSVYSYFSASPYHCIKAAVCAGLT